MRNANQEQECLKQYPKVKLEGEPLLGYKPGEIPLQCAICGVELVNLKRSLCGMCFDKWAKEVRL